MNSHYVKKTYQENPSQEKLTEFLLEKIQKYKNVSTKTFEVKNDKGTYYNIKINVNLVGYRNNLFYAAKLSTVSHTSRIINIKCIFTDNDNLKQDMKINADSLIQCFRAVAPDTIIDVHLDTFTDQQGYEHLAVCAQTIKNASIIYVYKRIMDFVNVVNDKYGQIPEEPYVEMELSNTISNTIVNYNTLNITSNQTSNTTSNSNTKVSYANIAKKYQDEQMPLETNTNTNTNQNKTTIKTELDIQEEYLLKQLENIKKLKQIQNK